MATISDFRFTCIMALCAQPAFSQTAPAPYVSVPYVQGEYSTILSDRPTISSGGTELFSLGQNTYTAESLSDIDQDSNYISVEKVGREDGDWVTIHFSDFSLGEESTLTIRSEDGSQTQTFDQSYLEESGGYTPMFPGGEAYVQLNKSAGDEEVFYLIEEVLVGVPPAPENTMEGFPPAREQMVEPVEAICEEDNRIPFEEMRVGRIMPVGCTGWNIDEGVHVTAGHCMRGNRMLQLQLDVPLSDPDGGTNPPGLENQFVIVQDSIAGKDLGIGEDFAVFRTLPNNRGETSHDLHGFIEVTEPSEESDALSVMGFGLDDDPPGPPPMFRNQSSQTLQADSGPSVEITSNIVKHRVDTRGGNSGGPIVIADTDQAIAIHTHGGCEEGANHGTDFRHPELQALIKEARGAANK